jgi:hypothetical protein
MKAFPLSNMTGLNQQGMELRDYFAAKAMQGLLAGMSKGEEPKVIFVGNAAYKIADLMMKARNETA